MLFRSLTDLARVVDAEGHEAVEEARRLAVMLAMQR